MEIFGLVRVTLWRALATIVIMALAAAAAGFVVLSRPAQVRSSNAVLLDQLFGVAPGTDADVAAENLSRSYSSAAARSDPAAHLTGVQGVRGAGSTVLDVQVTGTGPATAVREAGRTLAERAVADFLQQQLQASQTTLNAAQQRLADAQGKLDAFSTANNVADVPTALITQGQLVATLQASVAAGGPTGALAAAQKQLDRLLRLRPQFGSLQATRDAAQSEDVRNLSAVALVQTRIALQRSGVAILQEGTGKVSQLLPAVRAAVGAAAVVLVVLLALFASLDARRRRRAAAATARATPAFARRDADEHGRLPPADEHADPAPQPSPVSGRRLQSPVPVVATSSESDYPAQQPTEGSSGFDVETPAAAAGARAVDGG